jgi:hypothetical protein
VITTKVKAKLAEEKMSTLTKIQFDTDRNGAVFLSGKNQNPDRSGQSSIDCPCNRGCNFGHKHHSCTNG